MTEPTNTCAPCRLGVPALTEDESRARLARLDGWSIVDNHHLEKVWRVRDFATAMTRANAVAALADQLSHHPEILVAWGRLQIRIWTHKSNGLTDSDFVLAAHIDQIDVS